MSDRPPAVRARRRVYRNPWFEIHEKEVTGFDQPYYVLSTGDYATVVPVTEDGQIVFVRQYRPSVEAHSLELPGGHVEAGESPEFAVRRELTEETGYEALELRSLGALMPDTGRMSNRLWTFVCTVRQVGAPEAGIELVLRPAASLKTMISTGELAHALDLAVLLKAVAEGWLPL